VWWTLVPAKFPDSALPSMDLPPRVIPVLDFEPGPAPQEHRAATLQSTRMQCASSFPSASQAYHLVDPCVLLFSPVLFARSLLKSFPEPRSWLSAAQLCLYAAGGPRCESCCSPGITVVKSCPLAAS